MKCCAECFGDEGLEDVISYRSKETGKCGYCGSTGVVLVEPGSLSDLFEQVISIYEIDKKEGKQLAVWLKQDWALFRHQRMDDANAQRLLGDILDDGQIVRELFSPASKYASGLFSGWETLRDELRHRNRYFPKSNMDLERFEALLGSLCVSDDQIGTSWFRGRVQVGNRVYVPEEMKAPPPERTTNGRANPAGIPYLYLASDAVTAISEVRPQGGERVSVASFRTSGALRLIDLRHPKQTVSPFRLVDQDEVGDMRCDLTFLEALGEELTRPVVREAASFDYTPSQYLCEFIKAKGYDGVIYRSSVSDGVNVALFESEGAKIGSIQQHLVARVVVESSPV